MVALARKTLFREWRRFLPAVLTVCFAGLLLIVQAALVLGIFGSAAIYVTASSGDLWVGYPGTQSVNLGRPIYRDVEMLLRMNPAVTRVEPFLWVDADWHATGVGGVAVSVVGIDPSVKGMVFDHMLSPTLRQDLQEPGSIVVGKADLGQLGVQAGDHAWINGHRVHIVAVIPGLRALGGVNVISSLDTAHNLDPHAGFVTYYVAKLADYAQAPVVAENLNGNPAFGPYQVWTAPAFALRSQLFWMFDTGAGIAVVFLAVIVVLVGAVIASQTLTAVVISLAAEYATLNALGVGMPSLRWVVMEQATWIGGLGLIGGGLLSAVLLVVAHGQNVPVAMTPQVGLICGGLVLALALISGLLAMRGLLRADPASLLR